MNNTFVMDIGRNRQTGRVNRCCITVYSDLSAEDLRHTRVPVKKLRGQNLVYEITTHAPEGNDAPRFDLDFGYGFLATMEKFSARKVQLRAKKIVDEIRRNIKPEELAVFRTCEQMKTLDKATELLSDPFDANNGTRIQKLFKRNLKRSKALRLQLSAVSEDLENKEDGLDSSCGYSEDELEDLSDLSWKLKHGRIEQEAHDKQMRKIQVRGSSRTGL